MLSSMMFLLAAFHGGLSLRKELYQNSPACPDKSRFVFHPSGHEKLSFAARRLPPVFITGITKPSSWSARGAGEQRERLGRQADRDLALGDKRFGNRAAASLPALLGRVQVFLPLPRRDRRSHRSRRVAEVEQHERFARSCPDPAPDRQGFLLLEGSNCHVLLARTSEAGQPLPKRDQLLIKVPQHAMGALSGEGVVEP